MEWFAACARTTVWDLVHQLTKLTQGFGPTEEEKARTTIRQIVFTKVKGVEVAEAFRIPKVTGEAVQAFMVDDKGRYMHAMLTFPDPPQYGVPDPNADWDFELVSTPAGESLGSGRWIFGNPPMLFIQKIRFEVFGTEEPAAVDTG